MTCPNQWNRPQNQPPLCRVTERAPLTDDDETKMKASGSAEPNGKNDDKGNTIPMSDQT